MTYSQVVHMLENDVVETIAKGVQNHVYEQGTSRSVFIKHNGYRATLVQRKGSNAWLINAFELFDNKSDDGAVKSKDLATPTHNTTTLYRDDVGASDNESILQDNSTHKLFSKIVDETENSQSQQDNDNIVNEKSTVQVIKELNFTGDDSFNTHLDNIIDNVIGNYSHNETNIMKPIKEK